MTQAPSPQIFQAAVLTAAQFRAKTDEIAREADRARSADDIVAKAHEKAAEIIAEAEARAAQRDAELALVSDEVLQRFMQEELVDEAAKALHGMFETSQAVRADFDDLAAWFRPLLRNGVTQIVGALPEEQLWRGLVEQALGEVRDRWELTLRCHPSRRDMLADLVEGSDVLTKAIREVQGDRDLGKNDCFLLSGQGVLDIGVETQIEAFLRAVELHLLGDNEDDAGGSIG